MSSYAILLHLVEVSGEERRGSGLITHTALDGSEVIIDADVDLSLPAMSTQVLLVGMNQREFTGGDLDLGFTAAADVHEVVLSEEYELQGGRLRIGHRNAGEGSAVDTFEAWIGVWEGESASVVAHLYEPAGSSGVIELFNAVQLSESVEGEPIVRPRAEYGLVPDAPPDLAKLIPGLGLVQVERMTPAVAESLPTHPGAQVAGGELFVNEGPPPFFLLANARTLTTILPSPGISLARALRPVEKMVIDWTDAA
jgi:hypothetical protein